MRNKRRDKGRLLQKSKLAGWTLSETLVMMIIAGIVFVSVMDGFALFNRFAGMKTKQIVDNMQLWEGYYHLRDLVAAADSISMSEEVIGLFREGETMAELFEADSMLVARYGPRTDTLMSAISELKLAGAWELTGTDTLLLAVRNTDGNTLALSFPVVPPLNKLLVKNISEREKDYEYE